MNFFLTVVTFFTVSGFLCFWATRRAYQRTLFTNKPYKLGHTMQIADHRDGRCYGKLTPAKIQAIRNDGYRVITSPTKRAKIVIPAYGLSDAVTQGSEIGMKHHLCLLW